MTPENQDEGQRTPDPGDPLHTRVARTVERHAMLASGDRVLVGVSGGADSVALADILCALAPRYGIQVAIAHLDHGLRPEDAAREAELVRRLAARLALECHQGRIAIDNRRGSLEEQLRLLRYAFLEHTAAMLGCTKIAIGHHADDNAEQVLLHLLRGSGLRGLGGIPPVRSGRIIRPLIDIRRRAIVAYLMRRGLDHLEDPSNRDLRFDRNKIRHRLLPLLQREYNPGVVALLNRLAGLSREEDAWITTLAEKSADAAILSRGADYLEMDVKIMGGHPAAAQRRILRAALESWLGQLRKFGLRHIEALRALFAEGRKGRCLDLPNRIVAMRIGAVVRLQPRPTAMAREPVGPPSYRHEIHGIGDAPVTVSIPEAHGELRFAVLSRTQVSPLSADERRMALLDMDLLTFPLVVRCCRSGDRLHPLGMVGSQKLKKIFNARRIPASRRWRTPILCQGDAILWVVGVRRGQPAALGPSTARVLMVEWIDG